jgi:hypothetical protein
MRMETLLEPLSLAAREELERIIKEDLENATVFTASVQICPDGRVIIEEITFRLPDGRMASPAPVDGAIGTAVDLRLDIYDDRLPGGHGWREATVAEDYAEDLADATRVWRPEPDTVEEARL